HYQVFCQTVTQVLVLGVCAHVQERQDGDGFLSARMPVGLHEGRGTRRCSRIFDPVNVQRVHDIFECHRPHPFQRFCKPLLDLIEDLLGNADTAWSRQRFDASSDVHAVPNYIVVAADNVAQVDSYTHLKTPLCWIARISLCDRLLNLNPAFHCLQRARKLDQKTVSDRLNFRATMLWKNRAQKSPMLLKKLKCNGLIALSERAVADHVSEHDGGEPAIFRAV